jgi:hypothetical protein
LTHGDASGFQAHDSLVRFLVPIDAVYSGAISIPCRGPEKGERDAPENGRRP